MVPVIDRPMQEQQIRQRPFCISDHFAIMVAFHTGDNKVCNKSEQHTHKYLFNKSSIDSFRL